jgi:hypothetical protein
MSWSIPVPLQPDETLSSWLVRAALLQGCDPLVLTGSVWPGWRVWTIDVDRGLTENRVKALAAKSGVGANRFVSASLHSDAKRIAGRTLSAAEAWPWVLALGSRNRRRLGGQQYCATCLTEDKHPYFRREWRLAWHVACVRHHILLIDRCGACGAPIAFHRLLADDGDLAVCSRCRADLRQVTHDPAPRDALAFQALADVALDSGAGEIWRHGVTTAEWFLVARFLVDTFRRAGRHPASRLARSIRTLASGMDAAVPEVTGLPLEALPVSERASLLGASFRLMGVSPTTWMRTLRENGVTDVALLGDWRHLPAPLTWVASSLPEVRRVVKRRASVTRVTPHSETAVKRAWARLQRRVQADDP